MKALLAACFVLWAAVAQATTTYFVSINAAGADNSACDGSTATNTGSGHCPFKDLTSVTVRNLIQNVSDVTMKFCAGTYDVGATALIAQGTGSSFNQAVTITNCDGEAAILDGGLTSRETVRLSGSYVRIVRAATGTLTVQRAHDYNIECRGADHVEVLDLVITTNAASDLVKGDGGCSDVSFLRNDLSLWVSQCMDLAGVARWTISNNYCHRPQVTGQPCIGAKFKADDVTVSNNILEGCAVGVAMGGVSSSHVDTYEALRVIVDHNQFVNLTSFAADVYSCTNCQFRYNSVWGGVAGIRLGGIGAQGQSGCNSGAGNCDATSGFIALSNIFRAFVASPNNSFWLVNSTDISGFTSTGNRYCTVPGDATDRYAIDSVIKTRAQWQAGVSTDTDAEIIAAPDLRCSGRTARFRAKRR